MLAPVFIQRYDMTVSIAQIYGLMELVLLHNAPGHILSVQSNQCAAQEPECAVKNDNV